MHSSEKNEINTLLHIYYSSIYFFVTRRHQWRVLRQFQLLRHVVTSTKQDAILNLFSILSHYHCAKEIIHISSFEMEWVGISSGEEKRLSNTSGMRMWSSCRGYQKSIFAGVEHIWRIPRIVRYFLEQVSIQYRKDEGRSSACSWRCK